MAGNFQYLAYDNFVTADAVTDSNGDSDYSPTYVQNYWNLGQRWQSVDATESAIIFDLGAADEIFNIGLHNVNFTSFKIQANTSDSWGSPAYDSGAITVSKNRHIGRWHNLETLDETYRYWRLLITAQTPADGLSYFRVGTVVFGGAAMTTVDQNPQYPLTAEANKKYIINEFPSGGDERINIGNIRRWQASFTYLLETADKTVLWDWLDMDEDDIFQFYMNNDDDSEVYLCNRTGSISVEEPASTYIKSNTIIFDEVI